MEFIGYGVDVRHKAGEFCLRKTFPHYFISYFRTAYVAELGGMSVRGQAGDYLIMEPGHVVYHGPIPDVEEGFRNDWMYISGSDLSDLLKTYPLPCGTPFRIEGTLSLASVIESIHKEKSLAQDGYEDVCDLLMKRAWIDLYRSYKKDSTRDSSDVLAYVRGEVLRRVAQPWTLDGMARLSGYSPTYFCAQYRKRFGISPVNDLLEHRLEEAKNLMLYGDMSVSEIAHAAGFSSLYYFSKYFKKKEGVSPSEYKSRRML